MFDVKRYKCSILNVCRYRMRATTCTRQILVWQRSEKGEATDMADEQNAERLIVVAGATGNQGGAVARSLLDSGFRVRGPTRNPQKPEAQGLSSRAIRLRK